MADSASKDCGLDSVGAGQAGQRVVEKRAVTPGTSFVDVS